VKQLKIVMQEEFEKRWTVEGGRQMDSGIWCYYLNGALSVASSEVASQKLVELS